MERRITGNMEGDGLGEVVGRRARERERGEDGAREREGERERERDRDQVVSISGHATR